MAGKQAAQSAESCLAKTLRDVWVANAANSFITRFIDISSREDMLKAVTELNCELRKSMSGRGILSSFDVRMARIEEKVPDRVLSAAQLRQGSAQ